MNHWQLFEVIEAHLNVQPSTKNPVFNKNKSKIRLEYFMYVFRINHTVRRIKNLTLQIVSHIGMNFIELIQHIIADTFLFLKLFPLRDFNSRVSGICRIFCLEIA